MKRPLRELISIDVEDAKLADLKEKEIPPVSDSEIIQKGFCIECGDQRSEISCLTCKDDFCLVCFGYLHRTGKRKLHKTRKLKPDDGQPDGETIKENSEQLDNNDTTDAEAEIQTAESILEEQQKQATVDRSNVEISDIVLQIKNHCQFIPMRLTMDERKLLRLLEAALNVSDYTDKVDVTSFKSKSKRIVAQLREMCSILAGLVVATDMDLGKSMFFRKAEDGDDEEEEEDFSVNAEWYKRVFEIGRRYKIMNPEKMRDSFGKLMYMIMDSRLPEIKEALEFDFYKPISTVYSFLEENDALALLDDPLIITATTDIVSEGKSRPTIQAEIRRKENSIKLLAKKYSSTALSALYGGPVVPDHRKRKGISAEDVRQCLYSIGDYHSYLRSNRHPVESIIKLLNQYFTADGPSSDDPDFSLGISSGQGGSRLSHSHTKQFHYVQQSLTLWSEIMRKMFQLWFQADSDLVSEKSRYQLTDTGQGLNRIKPCPSVARTMHNIIRTTMDRTGQWIGSSVVHLGDKAVPNALFFLDKYTQVPRILTPVFLVIKNVEDIVTTDSHIREFIESQFGSIDGLKMSKLLFDLQGFYVLTKLTIFFFFFFFFFN